MKGLMMDCPLTLPLLLEHAARIHGGSEIVTRKADRSLHRLRYADFAARARRLASALQKAGLKRGDRVATLMWNSAWHLEAYFGIPAAGGVLHTLNLRLHPDDLAYIVGHAGDRFLIVDDLLLGLLDKFRDRIAVERVIVVPLAGQPVPAGCEGYEEFLATGEEGFVPPALDEQEACGTCYTSGTTGRPKGVVYSHRAVVLHSLGISLPDVLALSMQDALMPVVPMFHVNAWGLPFAGVMVGARMVMPGPHLDAESLLDLFEAERVTCSAGVPTIWLNVLNALKKQPDRWRLGPGLRLVVGGSAAPESQIRGFDAFGVNVLHAWGMTEMTPLGTVSRLKPGLAAGDEDARYAVRAKQGLPVPLVEVRVVGDQGEAPWDGRTMGELQVRGPWVAAGYVDPDQPVTSWTEDGWFRTGDVATIDPEGYVKITDRTKDLVKSGGEWISSIDLENALMSHPAVREAAVVAVPHPKWQERPLACVVRQEGTAVSELDLRAHISGRFPDWWLPDAIVFVDELPKTSTGKFLKSRLREQYKDFALPA